MKTKCLVWIVGALFALCGCTTGTGQRSYDMAAEGRHSVELNYLASKEALRAATLEALTAGKWHVAREGEVLRAQLNHKGVDARLYITFADDRVMIDSAGSKADGKPVVPLRWIDFLDKRIKKNLAASGAVK